MATTTNGLCNKQVCGVRREDGDRVGNGNRVLFFVVASRRGLRVWLQGAGDANWALSEPCDNPKRGLPGMAGWQGHLFWGQFVTGRAPVVIFLAPADQRAIHSR